MDRIQSRGRIIAGISFDIPGVGYRNPRTGLIEGFEADLARAIAEELLGAPDRVDFFQVTDEQRIPALQNDLVDMVLSQITITPDRAGQVGFLYSVFSYARGDSRAQGKQHKQFRRPQRQAHRRHGRLDLSSQKARCLPSLPGATLILTPLSSGNLEAVAKGEADAASNDLINLTLMRRACDHPDR